MRLIDLFRVVVGFEHLMDVERQLEDVWEEHEIGDVYHVHICTNKVSGRCRDEVVSDFRFLEKLIKRSLPHCHAVTVERR